MAMMKRMLHSIFQMQTFVNENPQKKNKENVQTCNQLFRSSAVGNSASSMSYYSSFVFASTSHTIPELTESTTDRAKERRRDREGGLDNFFLLTSHCDKKRNLHTAHGAYMASHGTEYVPLLLHRHLYRLVYNVVDGCLALSLAL